MPKNGPEDLNGMLNAIEQSSTAHTSPADYESPTLAMLDAKRRPNPLPICAGCPQSLWFASAEHVQCYCRLMHAVTWTSETPIAILQCDGAVMSTE